MPLTIAELKRRRAQIVAEMKAIASKDDDDDNGGLTDEDKDRFDALSEKVKEHDDRIERLEAANDADAKSAKEVDDDDDDGETETRAAGENMIKSYSPLRSNLVINHARPKNEPKGTRFARFIIGQGIAKSMMDRSAGASYVRDQFDDREVAKALGATGTQASGGALIPMGFSAEVVDLLWAKAVVRQSGAQVMPMPFGNITLPRMSASSSSYWIGENTDVTISTPSVSDIYMTSKKLASLVPCSMDLVRRAPMSVEALVRNTMIRNIALTEDTAFLTGASGSSTTPCGLVNWAGNTVTATTASSLSLVNVLATLNNFELSLTSNNVPLDNAKWFFNPAIRSYLSTLTDQVGRYFFREELDRGVLLGHPYLQTNILPSNLIPAGSTLSNASQIIFANPDYVVIGDTMNMIADSSVEAGYVSSGSVVSAYSRDQILFRTILEVDLNVLHPNAVSVSEVTNWLPAGYTGVAGAQYAAETYAGATSSGALSAG